MKRLLSTLCLVSFATVSLAQTAKTNQSHYMIATGLMMEHRGDRNAFQTKVLTAWSPEARQVLMQAIGTNPIPNVIYKNDKIVFQTKPEVEIELIDVEKGYVRVKGVPYQFNWDGALDFELSRFAQFLSERYPQQSSRFLFIQEAHALPALFVLVAGLFLGLLAPKIAQGISNKWKQWRDNSDFKAHSKVMEKSLESQAADCKKRLDSFDSDVRSQAANPDALSRNFSVISKVASEMDRYVSVARAPAVTMPRTGTARSDAPEVASLKTQLMSCAKGLHQKLSKVCHDPVATHRNLGHTTEYLGQGITLVEQECASISLSEFAIQSGSAASGEINSSGAIPQADGVASTVAPIEKPEVTVKVENAASAESSSGGASAGSGTSVEVNVKGSEAPPAAQAQAQAQVQESAQLIQARKELAKAQAELSRLPPGPYNANAALDTKIKGLKATISRLEAAAKSN